MTPLHKHFTTLLCVLAVLIAGAVYAAKLPLPEEAPQKESPSPVKTSQKQVTDNSKVTSSNKTAPRLFLNALAPHLNESLTEQWDVYLLTHRNLSAADYSALIHSSQDKLDKLISLLSIKNRLCETEAQYNPLWFKQLSEQTDVSHSRIQIIFLLKGILFEQRQAYLAALYDEILVAEAQHYEMTKLWFTDFDKFLTQLDEDKRTVLSIKNLVKQEIEQLHATRYSQPLQTQWAQNALFQSQKGLMDAAFVASIYQHLNGQGCFDLVEVIAPLTQMVLR